MQLSSRWLGKSFIYDEPIRFRKQIYIMKFLKSKICTLYQSQMFLEWRRCSCIQSDNCAPDMVEIWYNDSLNGCNKYAACYDTQPDINCINCLRFGGTYFTVVFNTYGDSRLLWYVRYVSTTLHGITSRKQHPLQVIAVSTQNLIQSKLVHSYIWEFGSGLNT